MEKEKPLSEKKYLEEYLKAIGKLHHLEIKNILFVVQREEVKRVKELKERLGNIYETDDITDEIFLREIDKIFGTFDSSQKVHHSVKSLDSEDTSKKGCGKMHLWEGMKVICEPLTLCPKCEAKEK